VDRRLGCGMNLARSSAIPGNQTIEIVAVGSVRTESLLIEQTLDATTQANLIRAILVANRPTHFAVPATAKDYNSRRSQPSRDHTERPQPTRLLFLFTHQPQPVSPSND
jgi:hypothetical protein